MFSLVTMFNRTFVLCLISMLPLFTGCSGSDEINDTDGDGTEVETDDNNTTDGDLDSEKESDTETTVCPSDNGNYKYDAPLASDSPWPKFRRDIAQTGYAPFSLCDNGSNFWSFKTGKGIFSSPVVGGDGTIYIGSADRTFYAIYPDGTERWHFETGEIIDSSALLDDKGLVYFGSGDGKLYALDAQNGEKLWDFEADDPSERNAFINWFEGNVTIHPNGNLVLGNDNWYIYSIDRDSGQYDWRFETPDQTWALPAIDKKTGNIFICNNNVLLPEVMGNVFAVDKDGKKIWKSGTLGTIAASPLLYKDSIIFGSFDGYIRSLSTTDGKENWNFGTRDHVYSSVSLHPEGFVVAPSADGSIYALNPDNGEVEWAFDWSNPVRSSPAIDHDGLIYMGTGDGYLLVLNPDGTLRWALKLIHEDRDDINGSPALSKTAIYIAGESGEVFGVPFDFCLRKEEATNTNCIIGGSEPLADDGLFVLFNTKYGSALFDPPQEIAAQEPMAFSVMMRENGDSVLALIDTGSLEVNVNPATDLEVTISAARNFFTVYPQTPFVTDNQGNISVTVSGKVLINPERTGLKFEGGVEGGDFNQSFTLKINDDRESNIPLPIPAKPGDEAGIWHMYRLAAPLPSILPSYNQIGFDSHHILIGLVEGNEQKAVAYGVEFMPGTEDELNAIPDTSAIMVFEVKYDKGRLILENNKGFSMGIQGTTIPFNLFRMSAVLDETGSAPDSATVQAVSVCGEIPVYGAFLQSFGFCHPDTDLFVAWGAALLEPYKGGKQNAPEGVGSITFTPSANSVTADIVNSTLEADKHTLGILLVDEINGEPVVIDYGSSLTRENTNNNPSKVVLEFDRANVPDKVRAYFMVDTYPAFMQMLDIPAAQ